MALFKKVDYEQEYSNKIASDINKEFKRRQEERRPWELQWRLNAEFLNGNQYLDINEVTMSIEEIPVMYEHQEREVFNQIATIFETRTSKISRQKPLLKTRPASGDDEDISAAKISSMLLRATWGDQNMDKKYNLFVPWMELNGTAFLMPVWDLKKGRVVARRILEDDSDIKLEQDIDTEDEDGSLGKNIVEEIVREGDIDTMVVSSYEIYPDSCWRESVEDCRSIIRAKAQHIDDIYDTWGQRVEAESVEVMTLTQSSVGTGGLGYSSGRFRGSTRSLKDHAVVKEYYERPSRRYPQGRFVVVAGDKTLYVGTLPYVIGEDETPEIPLVRAVAIDHPGCFWGKSVIERVIPVQRRYNAVRNRRAEYLNLVAIGGWEVPEGSIPADEEIITEPGMMLHYRTIQGEKPKPIQFPTLPSDFSVEERALLAEFTSISGVSELSRYSEAPSGVKSGVALGIANEQDDTRLATTVSNIANAVVQLGKYWIRLYRQFAREPRMLRSVGSSKEVELREWYASDLKSDDVIIENSSALAETPSQRRQMVFDLIGTGIFNRPETNPFTPEGQRKVFELLEFGHWEVSSEDISTLQTSRARKENMQIAEGNLPPIMDFDDDLIHLEQHDRFRMSSEYEAILKSPMGQYIDELMQAHKAQHLMRLQQNQQMQQMGNPALSSY